MVALIEGHHKAQRDRHEQDRARNHELATLVAFAFHDPQNIPDYEPAGGREKTAESGEPQSTEADLARVRGFFAALAGGA